MSIISQLKKKEDTENPTGRKRKIMMNKQNDWVRRKWKYYYWEKNLEGVNNRMSIGKDHGSDLQYKVKETSQKVKQSKTKEKTEVHNTSK